MGTVEYSAFESMGPLYSISDGDLLLPEMNNIVACNQRRAIGEKEVEMIPSEGSIISDYTRLDWRNVDTAVIFS